MSFPSSSARTYTVLLVTSRTCAERAHLLVFVDDGTNDSVDTDRPAIIVKDAVRIDTQHVSPRPSLSASDTAMTLTSHHPNPGVETGRLDTIVTEIDGDLAVIEHGLTYDYGDPTMPVEAYFNAHFALTVGDTFFFKSSFQTYEHPIVSLDEAHEGHLSEYQALALVDWRLDRPLPPEIAVPLEKWRALQA